MLHTICSAAGSNIDGEGTQWRDERCHCWTKGMRVITMNNSRTKVTS